MKLPSLRVGQGRSEEEETFGAATSRRQRGSRGTNVLPRVNSHKSNGNGRGSRGSKRLFLPSRSPHQQNTPDYAEPGQAEVDGDKAKHRLQSIFSRNVPISTSLHGDSKRRSKESITASLHGKVSEAKSSMSSSLHGLRGSHGSGGGANANALKTELANMRTILLAYKDENDELLQDLNIVLDENDFLNQELVKICDENENLVEDKQDLKEQLEEAQFEQEEAMLKYKDHMAICQLKNSTSSLNKRGGGRGTAASGRNKRGSLLGNMTDMRKAANQSFPMNHAHQNMIGDLGGGTNRVGNASESSSGNLTHLEQMDVVNNKHLLRSTSPPYSGDDEMSKLALSSLQAEMARKTRAWEEERARMNEQMQKYQDEMDQLRDAAQRYATQHKEQRLELIRIIRIMEQCDSCRTARKTEVEQERKAAQELQEFLASRTKGFVKTPSTVSQSDVSLSSLMKTDEPSPSTTRQASGLRGVGRVSLAIQDRLDRALQIAITGNEQGNYDCRSKSVCLTADDAESSVNSGSAYEKRSRSVVLNNVDRRNRRTSLCLGPDSELAKGLARLRNKNTNNDQTSLFADSVDLDDNSSVLPLSLVEPSINEITKDCHASQELGSERSIKMPIADRKSPSDPSTLSPIICAEAESDLAVNGKAYSTTQWKLAQSANFGNKGQEHCSGHNCHSASALPPIQLSLTQRYYTDTLDEESWVAGGEDFQGDGGISCNLLPEQDSLAGSSSVSNEIHQAAVLAEKIAVDRCNSPRRAMNGRGSYEKGRKQNMVDLISSDEEKKKAHEMNGDSSTFSGTRSATDDSDAETYEDEAHGFSRHGDGHSVRLGTLANINKLLGHERIKKCHRPRREDSLDQRDARVLDSHDLDQAQKLNDESLFVAFPDGRNGSNVDVAKRRFHGAHHKMKIGSRAPSA